MKAAAAITGKCLAGVLALAPAPAAAQLNSYEEAVAARQTGEPVKAVELLAPWIAANPQDVDARVQLGYALLALNDLDAAEAQFRAVISAAPDYADAAQGLALIERRRSAAPAQQRYVFIEGSLSDLSQGRKGWSEIAVGALLPVSRDASTRLNAAHYRRFGVEDVEVAGELTVQTSANSWLRAKGSGTPSADFRPEWSVGAGLDRRLGSSANPTVVGMDIGFQRYPVQDVLLVSPAVTQYFAGGRYSLTARANAVRPEDDSFRIGGALRADYFPRERVRLFLGAASGPDTDLGVVTTTTALFAGAELPLTSTLSLTASVAQEWRDGGFDRSDARLGLRLGF